jgi:hypothetical protein
LKCGIRVGKRRQQQNLLIINFSDRACETGASWNNSVKNNVLVRDKVVIMQITYEEY